MVTRVGQARNPRFVEVILVVKRALINVRQKKVKTGPVTPVLEATTSNRGGRISIFLADETGGEKGMNGMVIVESKAELLETIPTIQRSGTASNLLYGRQKKRHQDRYDRNDNQQFDQRESRSASSAHGIDPCEQPENPRPDARSVDARRGNSRSRIAGVRRVFLLCGLRPVGNAGGLVERAGARGRHCFGSAMGTAAGRWQPPGRSCRVQAACLGSRDQAVCCEQLFVGKNVLSWPICAQFTSIENHYSVGQFADNSQVVSGQDQRAVEGGEYVR
mgnify:CR=1 FL=1